MKFKEYYMNENLNYTKEMEDWFNKRTRKHIELVQKYANMIAEFDPEKFGDLIKVTEVHDLSKLNSNVERIPYIFISWNYHCKDLGKPFEVPLEIKDQMNEATLHHIKNNKHHPEFWAGETAQINKDDRDAITKELVDATMMPDLYLGEMCCDWQSMSIERKNNTIREWADRNINIRWKFTPHQKELIYNLISIFENINK